MIDALRSEWRKVIGTRSLVVLMLCAIGLSALFSALATGLVPLDDSFDSTIRDDVDRSVFLMSGLGIARILLASLGALVIGQEFRFSTIRVTLAAEPRRGRVLAAKAIVTGAVGFATMAVGVALAAGIGGLILSARGAPVAFDDGSVQRALGGWVLNGAAYALTGLAVGTVLRQPIGAIIGLVVWRLLVETIIPAVFPDAGGWLPFTAGDRIIEIIPTDIGGPAGWAGFAWLLVVMAGLFALGAGLFARRDA